MVLTMALSLAVLGQLKLPGSSMTTDEAVQRSNLVIVAEAVSFGVGSGHHGELYAAFFKVKPTAVLKGGSDGKKVATISFNVVEYLPFNGKLRKFESLPTIKNQYLLFINGKRGRDYDAIKILPSTNENIEHVRDLISK